jgi:hypothetical protein
MTAAGAPPPAGAENFQHIDHCFSGDIVSKVYLQNKICYDDDWPSENMSKD